MSGETRERLHRVHTVPTIGTMGIAPGSHPATRRTLCGWKQGISTYIGAKQELQASVQLPEVRRVAASGVQGDSAVRNQLDLVALPI
jgi:hypothetical protein